jgi:hypothetical protein
MKILAATLFLSFVVLLALGQSNKDIKSNKIKSIITWQNDKGDNSSEAYKDSYEVFDKYGNTTLKIRYKKDGSVSSKETCKYDKNQNKIEEFVYEDADKVLSHKVYVYNALHKKTEEREFSPAGELVRETMYTYNLEGEKSSETCTDPKGNLLKKVEYKYNSRSLKTQKSTTDKADKTESVKKWAYEYY